MVKWHLTPKEVREVVAAQVAHHPVMRARAETVKAAVLAQAAVHNKTGAYVGRVVIRDRNAVDFEVAATDPAAAHIEFGHRVARNPDGAEREKDSSGSVKGASTGKGVSERRGEKWVNGLHIMRNAAISAGADKVW